MLHVERFQVRFLDHALCVCPCDIEAVCIDQMLDYAGVEEALNDGVDLGDVKYTYVRTGTVFVHKRVKSPEKCKIDLLMSYARMHLFIPRLPRGHDVSRRHVEDHLRSEPERVPALVKLLVEGKCEAGKGIGKNVSSS